MSNEQPSSGQGGRKEIPIPSAPVPNSVDRTAAQKEEQELASAASEHQRGEVARRIIAWGMWILIVVVFIIIIAAVATLGFHLLVPCAYHWLKPDELQEVKNAVLSGAVVGLGTTYLRRYLEEKRT